MCAVRAACVLAGLYVLAKLANPRDRLNVPTGLTRSNGILHSWTSSPRRVPPVLSANSTSKDSIISNTDTDNVIIWTIR